MAAVCSQCKSHDVLCEHKFESDGAAWSWITWTHVCRICGHVEKSDALQYSYDHEELLCCFAHVPSKSNTPAICTRCNSTNVQCGFEDFTDSILTKVHVVWMHKCLDCKHVERKEIRNPNYQEEIDCCSLLHKK